MAAGARHGANCIGQRRIRNATEAGGRLRVKALILGAGGQVGRAVVLAAPSWVMVTALSREQCDISDKGAVQRALVATQPNLVFNAAAYTAVDRAETDPDQARLINAYAPGFIGEAARSVGARTVHLS